MRDDKFSMGRSALPAIILVGRFVLGSAITAGAKGKVKLKAVFSGEGADDAIVSFYLIDDATGEALLEVTADEVNKSGSEHKAEVEMPENLKKAGHLWAVRVDARGAGGDVFLLSFTSSEGEQESVDAENITGQTRWFVAGDEEDEDGTKSTPKEGGE